MRRVRRGSISSKLLMCCGGVRSILLLPLVVRCLETIEVCILLRVSEVLSVSSCRFVCLYLVCIMWQFSMLCST